MSAYVFGMDHRAAASARSPSWGSQMATTSQRRCSTYPGTLSCAMLPAPTTPSRTRSTNVLRIRGVLVGARAAVGFAFDVVRDLAVGVRELELGLGRRALHPRLGRQQRHDRLHDLLRVS